MAPMHSESPSRFIDTTEDTPAPFEEEQDLRNELKVTNKKLSVI